MDELRATGNTPIGPALLHAADELDGIEGPRSIILVSDGEPNCEPPPACEVAQELANRGIELTIHTIGFRISENRVAREVLRCIAETTGGEYMDAENADQLTEALDEQTTRAMISYEAEGERVDGGPTSQRATPLLAGQFVTSLRGGEEPRSIEDEWPNVAWFSAAAHDGWRLNVSATLIEPNREGLPAGDRRSLRLSLHGEERSCFLSANSSVSQTGYEMAPYLTATGRSSDAR